MELILLAATWLAVSDDCPCGPVPRGKDEKTTEVANRGEFLTYMGDIADIKGGPKKT